METTRGEVSISALELADIPRSIRSVFFTSLGEQGARVSRVADTASKRTYRICLSVC